MERIFLAHGGGGEKTQSLITGLFQRYLSDPLLKQMDDSAVIGGQVFTTDSFVVSPLFFPGGDIGRLAVCGTVNDIAVMGARPLYLSLAFILEEGLELSVLERVLCSIESAAGECSARVVAGDTKVVEKGRGDGLFISAAGIGETVFSPPPAFSRIREGDCILISGTIGDHALAVVAARGEFGFQAPIVSDVAPLWSMVEGLKKCDIHFMRDPTRGGVAQTLNEIAASTDLECAVEAEALPVKESVQEFCHILGYEPLYLANEGKVVAVAPAERAEETLQVLRRHPLGAEAAIIGRMRQARGARGKVYVSTAIGTERLLMPPAGELLPRIC